MRYICVLLLLLACPALAAETVTVTLMPTDCQNSILPKCEGWLFTYHFREVRMTLLKDADGHSLHKMESTPQDVTFEYFVNDKPHNNEEWAATETAARAIADRIAVKQGVK